MIQLKIWTVCIFDDTKNLLLIFRCYRDEVTVLKKELSYFRNIKQFVQM